MKEFFDFVMQNQEGFITAVIIMVSTVIVFMGILKGAIFDRIPNKAVRRIVVFLTSIGVMFGATAILFVVNPISWDFYLPFAVTNNLAMIIVYCIYEVTSAKDGVHNLNAKLKNGIKKIGTFVLGKIFNNIVTKVNDVAQGTEVIGSVIDDILKGASKIDKDMDELKKL